jgi:ligand-binding SRPBCC domain-containing protein
MAIDQFRIEQTIPSTMERVWDFISSPVNLKEITPPSMGFEITTPDLPMRMYPGMIISYRVTPLFGIRMTWVTEITHMQEGEYFVDEQRVGPYAMWHHQHRIESVPGGVRMIDIVTYRPPFGLLGAVANALILRRRVAAIFRYRAGAMERKFGTTPAAAARKSSLAGWLASGVTYL